jgi:glutaredoxin
MITVYGTKTCSKCRIVKNILTERNIPFRYVDIDEFKEDIKQEFYEDIKNHGVLSLPAIMKDGIFIKDIPTEA